MNANKDAAKAYLRIGNKALQEGDKSKAFKYLKKAYCLDTTLPLGLLLSSLEEDLKLDDGGPDTVAQKRTKQNISNPGENSYDSTTSGPSTEQLDIVQRLRKTKDYYEILGLSKNCTAEDIRKAYRKISLKVHPDKNCAPGAEDAFKLVSKAFSCLSNVDSRSKYDLYGSDEPQRIVQPRSTRYRYSHTNFPFEDMFDADEIFNSFFFGSENEFHRAQYVRRYRTSTTGARQTQQNCNNDNFNGFFTFLQLLPILALLLLALFPFSKPVYSMDQVAPYDFQFSTVKHQVPFYVTSMDFEKEYPPGSFSRKNVEARVERDMMDMLSYHCRRELHRQRWNRSLKTPNCDKLQAFYVE
ncbi:hypothetical protein KP509_35G044300 [Ceratopteris richardii]|uniref:J domain-containing protein n=1 Tax=Ceratopteris richardii TaxID=49495 RepID=A0A8T2QGF3_CERRI|nr:hypothetical protein KP509_1Z311400 [Ceratopteris richardii]KAH7282700.1 hypothetical protein KP509_35G044300 [Ceratopteris richardii]KAH7282701.1 hypothetical protein KP509_35G044300 [Ceratopteris richardii]